ncbi:MAG: ABC transporter ATP-binding protein [Pseudomonadota bacterium]
MIRLQNLCKTYRVNGQRTCVADNVTMTLPGRKSIALLGRNGAGKSSLLRMVAGTMAPDSGRVITRGTVSWPVGFAGSFHGDLSGAQNTRFVGRIYGVDTDALVESVQQFADLGPHFHLPVRSYSSGMKARLAFGLSMGIPFDTYLVDEVTSVGDAAFRDKSTEIFEDRMRNAGAIVVSHGLDLVQRICEHAVVLHNGTLTYHDSIGDGIAYHRQLIRQS